LETIASSEASLSALSLVWFVDHQLVPGLHQIKEPSVTP
jgi:hypothetical protein